MISYKLSSLALTGAALITLAACSSTPTQSQLMNDAHYWQRSSTSEAIYTRGPKAQQLLNRDTARCVTELRELDRLGFIRTHTPGDSTAVGAPDPSTPQGALAQWETPTRDGYLYAEHSDYHDFETCMMAKGWERIEHVPYDVAKEARSDYIAAINQQAHREKTGEYEPISPAQGEWDGLNE
ncbi:MAG: hypothetical protein HYS17_05000 [Micavibrio aeruginosavorus]|uniref:Lipoprotein n=1 Tax=Micavibrio aeruginosavorus TaxID=349221 RepID=A0A7T5R3Z0_9BACT|nr:MAG: hypothetical protein HYS17_05000 [Micavibrio aeruginosavorus]